MKNKYKVLIGVIAIIVLFICVILAVILLKPNEINNNGTNETTTYTQATDSEEVKENKTDSVTEKNSQLFYPVVETTTAFSNHNHDSQENQTHALIQNYKNYNLSNADVITDKNASFGKCRLYSVNSDGKRVFLIEVTSNGKKYYYEFLGSSVIEDVILKNVDSQKGDEIIILAKKSNGTYDNLVLRITSKGMVSLLSESEIYNISSSYTSELKENFNVDIYCRYGDDKTINVKNINKENYVGSYWDASGKLIEEFTEDPIWFDQTFCSLEVKDVDKDGVCEIICSQYASMGDLDSCVGYAKTTIKYSTEYDSFTVVNSTFVPAK